MQAQHPNLIGKRFRGYKMSAISEDTPLLPYIASEKESFTVQDVRAKSAKVWWVTRTGQLLYLHRSEITRRGDEFGFMETKLRGSPTSFQVPVEWEWVLQSLCGTCRYYNILLFEHGDSEDRVCNSESGRQLFFHIVKLSSAVSP